MDKGRHTTTPYDHLLARMGRHTYPDLVAAETSDVRRIRVEKALWEAYADVVGNGGRSADIKAYIAWRVDNPDTPLPGRRLGPVKKVRRSSTDAD